MILRKRAVFDWKIYVFWHKKNRSIKSNFSDYIRFKSRDLKILRRG